MTTHQDPGGVCDHCPHPFDPHAVIATGNTPVEGGIILCPECDCFATWSVPQLTGQRDPWVPEQDEIALIRETVFG